AETRPLLQGARLTVYEFSAVGMDVTLICDNMAASVIKKGAVATVVVCFDRVAANGDAANKIGTLDLAISDRIFNIQFYVCDTTSTIDMNTLVGEDIEIELRPGEEITNMWYEHKMGPEKAKTYNPAFDVTDHDLITAIITDKGIVYPPFEENLKKIMG